PSQMPSSKVKMGKSGIPGMRPFPRDKPKPIEEMNVAELRKLYRDNEQVLQTLIASSSSYVAKIEENQQKIHQRLVELEGMGEIQHRMRRATISEDAIMAVDSEPEDKELDTKGVKQKALANWGKLSSSDLRGPPKVATLSHEEAMELERQHNAFERERREREEARREKMTLPTRETSQGRTLTSDEYAAKVWAFMNYKPTDSDLEGEDEDDEDDDDPASWFHDEEDDGIKGQDIIYPDAEDLSDIIRMDESKIQYSSFYEPRDPDD
ncbi:uncharacterized protein FOMMEDRAFT_89417, partial [Fomitiporia mediterranea MF3/22]|uniref:uncharacterized protein n=1 Tax=Fomitiporia mediterranea (strain MF3/22) TaxID=694068 RepID=UPI0004408496